jgi:hypothetical protein
MGGSMGKRSTAAALVSLGTAALLAAGSIDAIALTATTTTMFRHSQDSPGVMGVAGEVSPAPTAKPHVIVRFFKKNTDGSWTLLDKRAAAWLKATGEGRAFTASMQHAPARGTCKLVAKYAGNATFDKSRTKAVIDCKTGYATTTHGGPLPGTG